MIALIAYLVNFPVHESFGSIHTRQSFGQVLKRITCIQLITGSEEQNPIT